MELHSYAKHKTSKKWSIEQKRKLVEARIKYDQLFVNNASTSVVPWKKILMLTKLDDYNVFFVRKQWSNMIGRYQEYKRNRLGDMQKTSNIDSETVREITQEWEFFEPIHRFMTRKSQNLHSYALMGYSPPQLLPTVENVDNDDGVDEGKNVKKQQQKQKHHIQQNNSNSSSERMNAFSSDTNEDYATINTANESQHPNTDHDFYTKKKKNGGSQQLSYFADVSEDTQESMQVELTAGIAATTTVTTTTTKTTQVATTKNGQNDAEVSLNSKREQLTTDALANNRQTMNESGCRTAHIEQQAAPCCSGASGMHQQQQASLSERDKYYRHKRRYNHRLERRFDALLNVFGQIVKAEYPSIDVSAISEVAASAGDVLVKTMFSSSEDEASDGSSNDEHNSTLTTPNMSVSNDAMTAQQQDKDNDDFKVEDKLEIKLEPMD